MSHKKPKYITFNSLLRDQSPHTWPPAPKPWPSFQFSLARSVSTSSRCWSGLRKLSILSCEISHSFFVVFMRINLFQFSLARSVIKIPATITKNGTFNSLLRDQLRCRFQNSTKSSLSILSCEIRPWFRHTPPRTAAFQFSLARSGHFWRFSVVLSHVSFQFSLARSEIVNVKLGQDREGDFQFSLARSDRALVWRLTRQGSLSILSCEISLDRLSRVSFVFKILSILSCEIRIGLRCQHTPMLGLLSILSCEIRSWKGYSWTWKVLLSILSCEIRQPLPANRTRSSQPAFNSLLRDQFINKWAEKNGASSTFNSLLRDQNQLLGKSEIRVLSFQFSLARSGDG